MKVKKILTVLLVALILLTLLPTSAFAFVNFTVEFKDWDGSIISSNTVEQGMDAVEPDHPTRDGYEPDGWDIGFTNVQSDLVITAKYKLLETYSLTINYFFEDNGIAAQPYIATVLKGESFAYDVDSPEVAGFIPSQANISGTLVDEDATFTVVYTPSGTTAYTVNYLTEDIDGMGYTLYDSELLSVRPARL